MQTILLALLFSYAYSLKYYYPSNEQLQVQWENDDWKDCSNNSKIAPFNCGGSEQAWNECYQVSLSGICFTKTLSMNSNQDGFKLGVFFANITQESQVTILINGESQSLTLSKGEDDKQKFFQFSSPLTSLEFQSTQVISLYKLTITEYYDSCGDDCCSDGEFLYNFVCTSDDCITTLSQLTTNTLVSSVTSVDPNYKIDLTFNVPLGDCLIPKVYLTKSLTDNSIKEVLDNSDVVISQTNNKLLTITIPDLTKCENIDTTDYIVNQCFTGVSLTFKGLTQYLLILISQIQIDKSTSSKVDNIQVINNPEDGDDVPIFVVNTVSNVEVDSTSSIIKATQQIDDPTYENSQIQLQSAALQQNTYTFPLTLKEQTQTATQVNYTLQWTDASFDSNSDYNLTITSQVQPISSRRLLTFTSRNQIQFSYKAQKIYQSTPTGTKKQDSIENSGLSEEYIIIIIIAGFLIAIILCVFSTYIDENCFSQQEHNVNNTNKPEKQNVVQEGEGAPEK